MKSCTPDELFKELFEDVQLGQVFEDQKTFPDTHPREEPRIILEEYRSKKRLIGGNLTPGELQTFLHEHFETYKPIEEHINDLWNLLTQSTNDKHSYDSLIPLPWPYVVPGGRYQELYYWDAYFIDFR